MIANVDQTQKVQNWVYKGLHILSLQWSYISVNQVFISFTFFRGFTLFRRWIAALADEPAFLPKTDLAEAVVKQIKINDQKAEAWRYNSITASVVIVGALSAYFAIGYINPDALKSALNFIEAYKWIFLFVIPCFVVIEIADKNLVKRKFVGSSLVH